MRRDRQLLPSLVTLMGVGLLIAAVYREVPPGLGMAGVVLLFAGGIWALWRTGAERREWARSQWGFPDGAAPPTLSDFGHGHHHHGGHHHGGFDAGGGLFDSGGGFDGGGLFDSGGFDLGGGGDGGGGGN